MTSLGWTHVLRSTGRARGLAEDAARRARGLVRTALPALRSVLPPRAAAWLDVAVAWARQNPRPAAGAGAAVFLLVAWALWPAGAGPGGVVTTEVREGPFRVVLSEAGTLQALRSRTYASGIQSNQAKIVALAPEGRPVAKGDLLILFDSAPFEEEIRRSQAQLSEAEADLEKARQDLTLQAIQNREDLAVAQQKLVQSDLELQDVQEGKGRLGEEEAEAAVAQAQRDVRKTERELEDLKPLLAEGFLTRQELEQAELAVEKAREGLALASRRRDSLFKYGRPVALAQARSDAARSRESLKQLEAAAASRLEQKKAAVAAAQSRIQEATARLAQARAQLARTEVRADVPGIVVYRDVFFGSEQRKPQVGDQVWANQPLLILPDVSRMVVDTRVRETDVHKVEQNQKVTVRVEAYPDLRLTGKVTLIGTLAQEERERRGPKSFGVTIEVNESEPRLRPGMSARVEIEVEERERALHVPLDAVFDRGGRHVCFVVHGRGLQAQEVVLGPSNQDFVVVEKGLRKGDRVALRDPEEPASGFGAPASAE